jgi:hypothetical protein
LTGQFHFYTDERERIKGAQTFNVNIDHSLLDWDAVESSDEFNAVMTLFQEVKSALDIIRTLYETITLLDLSNMERLDAFISSRAPASTALSNTVWTNARAANLDRLTAGVTAIAPRTRPFRGMTSSGSQENPNLMINIIGRGVVTHAFGSNGSRQEFIVDGIHQSNFPIDLTHGMFLEIRFHQSFRANAMGGTNTIIGMVEF